MDLFTYDITHQVIVCKSCCTCVAPGRATTERHLRRKSTHGLVGPTLRACVEYADSFPTPYYLRDFRRKSQDGEFEADA